MLLNHICLGAHVCYYIEQENNAAACTYCPGENKFQILPQFIRVSVNDSGRIVAGAAFTQLCNTQLLKHTDEL